MSSYCAHAREHPLHQPFHDREHGFPVRGEAALFERLILEISQAGLNWDLVLKKRESLRRAYDGYDVDRVAAYGEADQARLLADPGVIRNRLKIRAAVHNAGVLRDLRGSHGGFAGWLDAHHPLPKADWVRLFRKTFTFTGGEITGEFLMGTGYLPGAHDPGCPAGERAAALAPPWTTAPAGFYSAA